MPVTLNTNDVLRHGFCVNARSADWSGAETIVAAVSDKRHVIKRIDIFCVTETVVTFGSAESGGDIPAASIMLGPITVPALGHRPIDFPGGMAVPIGLPFIADTAEADDMTITVQGATKA